MARYFGLFLPLLSLAACVAHVAAYPEPPDPGPAPLAARRDRPVRVPARLGPGIRLRNTRRAGSKHRPRRIGRNGARRNWR